MSLYFIWNNVNSNDMGVVMLTAPVRITPAERVNYTDIPGRSGSLTMLEGENVHNDINIACTVIIEDSSRIDEICGWLHGGGTVIFGSRPDVFYKGRIANQLSFDQIVRCDPHRSFQVQFRCQPYVYLTSGLAAILVENGTPTQLLNEGNMPSLPFVRLEGNGEGGIMLGNGTMLISSFENVDYIILDCEAKIAYCGEKGNPSDPLRLLGTRVTGEWLTIPTGISHAQLSGGITSAEIIPKWRCM